MLLSVKVSSSAEEIGPFTLRLNHHLFQAWTTTKKQAVLRFVAAMGDSLPSESSREEWRQAAAKLVVA